MKKIVVFVLALVVTLGMSEIATAETILPTHKVKMGDTLSEISEEECRGASLYVQLAKGNKIAGPNYVITIGQDILLTCERKSLPVPVSTEESVATVAMEPTVLDATTVASMSLPLPEILITAPSTEEVMIESEVEVEVVVAEVVAERIIPIEEVVVPVQPEIKSVAAKGFFRKGLYEIIAEDATLKVGNHPARILVTQDKKNGQWNRSETRVSITRDDAGDARIQVFVEEDIFFNEGFVVMFDQGDGKPRRLWHTDLMKGRASALPRTHKEKIEKSKYSFLSEKYPQKPSWLARVIKPVREHGLSVTLVAMGYSNPISLVGVVTYEVSRLARNKAQEHLIKAAEALSAIRK